MFKKTLLIAALALLQATPSKAIESDDYGFPIRASQARQRSAVSYRASVPSYRFAARPATTVASRVVRVAPTAFTAPSQRFAVRLGVLNSLR